MKRVFIAVAALFLTSICMGQQNTDYVRVKNKGTLPESVYTPSAEKYKETLPNIDADLKRSEQKTQQQYYLESSFSIDDMMRSGIVLYNPAYNNYLEDIADVLLKDNPDLRNKVHFYLLRSPVVNAFAAGEGNIFISMGLIAMLDNESQLAFIMSHEAGHVAKKHSLDFYMKATAIDKSGSDKKLMKNASFNQKLIAKNLYSQKLETEADQFGIETLLKTGYSTESSDGVFDVLKYAYLPYENIKFPKSFFESDHYVISNNFMLDSVRPVTGEPELPNEEDALKSTHPSIGIRREIVHQYLDSIKTNDHKETAIVSQERFETLRNTARYELPMFYLHNQFYQDAIYASYLSLLKDSSSAYLETVIAKSLACLAKFRNSKDDEVYSEHSKFQDYEGEQEQLYYMLQNMSNAELTVLALRYAYQTHLSHPGGNELMPVCRSLVEDLLNYHFDDDNDFMKLSVITRDSLQQLADKNVEKVDPQRTTGKKSISKKAISKKASSKKSAATKTDHTKSHLLYAFNDFWGIEEFDRMWDEAFEKKRAAEDEAKYGQAAGEVESDRYGINKVVVINPFYLRIDVRKENAIEYLSSEEGEIRYVDVLKENAGLLHVDLDIIDPLLMHANDAERFNDMADLDDWFTEQLDFGSLDLPGHRQSVIDSIANKYGTDYFLWSGILSLQDRNNILMPLVYIICSPFFAPLLPYGVYELVSPEYEFFYLAVLFNVKTHEGEVLKYLFLEKNDTKAVLNSHTYDMFYQIKNEQH